MFKETRGVVGWWLVVPYVGNRNVRVQRDSRGGGVVVGSPICRE